MITLTPLTIYELLQIIVAAIGLFVIVGQLRVMQTTTKADHERRKLQATIEAIDRVDQRYLPLYTKLYNQFQGKPIEPNSLDPNTWELIDDLLTPLEYLAVGVNVGVYDKKIVMRLCGKFFVLINKQLIHFIDQARDKNKNPYYLGEFQQMCDELEVLDSPSGQIRPIGGNIRFSK